MNNLQVIERDNQRVMTTAVLAEEYGTTERRISENFNSNKERYTEGKHFYYLEGEELKEFLQSVNSVVQNPSKVRTLYLWTEKGALLHAKSLGTDRAWEVYEILVDSYFKKQPTVDVSTLNPEMQMFKLIFDSVAQTQLAQKQQQQALENMDKRIEGIKEVVALNPNDWRKDTARLINKMALKAGGYEHLSVIREESYNLLEQRYGVALSIRLTNKKKTLALNGVCKSKIDKLNKLDAIADDKKLIEGYISIVKEMAIKYGLHEETSVLA